MGRKNCDPGLPHRVYLTPACRGRREENGGPQGPTPKRGFRSRDCGSLREESSRAGSGGGGTPLPLVLLSHDQKRRLMETDPKFKASQQKLRQPKAFSDGYPRGNTANTPKGMVGSERGPKGRLLTYPHSCGALSIPSIRISWGGLPFQVTPVRPVYGTKGVYQSRRRGRCLPTNERRVSFCLPGRLAGARFVQDASEGECRTCGRGAGVVRLGDKHQEVEPHSGTNSPFLGGGHRLRKGDGSSFRKQDRGPGRGHRGDSVGFAELSIDMATSAGAHGESRGCGRSMSFTDEANPDPSVAVLQARVGGHEGPSPTGGSRCRSPKVVAPVDELDGGDTFPTPESADVDHDGCVAPRVGGALARAHSGRPMVEGRGESPHQSAGVESSRERSASVPETPEGFAGHRLLGQFDGRSLYQQARRHAIPVPVRGGEEADFEISRHRHQAQGGSRRRRGQRPGGRTVEGGDATQRMVVVASHLRDVVPEMGTSTYRSLRKEGKCETDNVLHKDIRSDGSGHGRILVPLGRDGDLCVPTTLSHSQDTGEGQGVVHTDDSNSSVLAKATVVPGPASVTGGDSGTSSGYTRQRGVGSVGGSQRHQRAAASCVAIIGGSLRKKGFSKKVADMAVRARRESTLRTYDSRLRRFDEWCQQRGFTCTSAPVTEVCSFLRLLFDEGKQVSTIKNYRSAVAAVHEGFADGSRLGDNEVVTQLLRGMSNSRPVVRRLAPAWGLSEVLRALARPPFEPIHKSELPALTKKVLFLVAAASARRRSCLQALTVKPNHIRFENHGVRLVPDPEFLAKNQTLDFLPGDIFLPEMKTCSSVWEDRLWCPVRAIKWYLKRTEALRQSARLFILPRPPYTPASKDTISRWIVEVITPHVSGGRGRAHDVRGLASSTALFSGVPIEDIIKAGAWKTPTTFVQCYLTDTLAQEAAFGRAVMGVPRGRSRLSGLPPL